MLPALPFAHIPRERLISYIDRPYQAAVTVVVGAAGSGKTTLVTEWAHQATSPIGWLSLTETDNEPTEFVARLREILRQAIEPAVTPGPMRDHAVTLIPREALLSEISHLEGGACLVLDNCELLTNADCISLLNETIAVLPARLRLVFISRRAVPLRLARLRSWGRVREIGGMQLRFRDDEATSVLLEIVPTGVPQSEIERITTMAEGWPAGVVLLGLSMQQRADVSIAVDDLANLSSANLDDYVEQEILAALPPELSEFVFATCGLPWVSADLCDASLITDNNAANVESLADASPFFTREAHRPDRYRYHPLVRESLARLARANVPERTRRDRLRRAVAWLIDAGELRAAAELALGSSDAQWIAETIEPLCRQLADRSDFVALSEWLDRVPRTVVDANFNLSYWKILASLGLLRIHGLDTILNDLGARMVASNNPLQIGRLHLGRGIIAYHAGQDHEAGTHLTHAHEILPSDAFVERLHCSTFIGQLAVRQGRDEAADIVYQEAEANALHLPLDQQWSWHVVAPGRANRYALRGDLFSAITKYRLILAEIPPYLADAGIDELLRSRLISLYIERNDLEAAEREDQIITSLIDGPPRAWHNDAVVAHARFLLGVGNHAEAEDWALDHLKRLRRLPQKTQLVHLLASIWLEHGEYPMVESWLEDAAPTEYPWVQVFGDTTYQMLAISLDLARERFDVVAQALERLTNEAIAALRWSEVIALSMRWAVALQSLGKAERSYEVARPAIERGARGGFVRAFHVPGFDTVTMFNEIWSERREYQSVRRGLQQLLHQIHQAEPVVLSSRELEVLRLVAEGRTNHQIAASMYISTNTVRNHLVRIGQRLEARNRQEAVTRARALRLLE